MIVPAKVKLLSVSPSRVAWGGTVRITGQLVGGYLPPGGALVRLRIGQGSSYQTYGVQEHVTGNGRFTTTYTFGAGHASSFQRFWFQIATLPMGAYPFAPSDRGGDPCWSGGTRRFRTVGPPGASSEATTAIARSLSEVFGVAMMNRRGMVRAHSHWRPSGGRRLRQPLWRRFRGAARAVVCWSCSLRLRSLDWRSPRS